MTNSKPNSARKINFPQYFQGSKEYWNFQSSENLFVRYLHKYDDIKDIQLNVECSFLLVVLNGQVKLLGNDGEFRVHAEQAAIVKKGAYIMSENLSEENKFNAILFFFEDDILRNFFLEREQQITPHQTQSVMRIAVSDTLKVYVNSVTALSEEGLLDKNHEGIIKHKAEELLLYLSHHFPSEIQNLIALPGDDESTISAVLKNNYLKNLSIEELAFLSNMSLSSFKRKFKSIYGRPPARWINDQKLEHAHRMLENSTKTISEISFELGYSSASYFIKVFKRKYGNSPNALRRASNLD